MFRSLTRPSARTRVIVALTLAVALVTFAPTPAAAAPVQHTVTFGYTGAQATWTVPADALSLQVELAGAAGVAEALGPGGRGGSGVVDLGAGYAGETLTVLVGGAGQGTAAGGLLQQHGGGGTFLLSDDGLLAVAGGGGGAGGWLRTANLVESQGATVGGDGGAPGVDGQNGQFAFILESSGTGAVGLSPGTPQGGATLLDGGVNGTVSSVSGGLIVAGLGGHGGWGSGSGGGGLAGGGGGSRFGIPLGANDSVVERGAGGGGSGYLDPALTVTSTGLNSGDGFVTFTYTVPAAVVPSAPVAQAPTLAATGADTDGSLLLAGLLLLLGGTLVIAPQARRGRAEHNM